MDGKGSFEDYRPLFLMVRDLARRVQNITMRLITHYATVSMIQSVRV